MGEAITKGNVFMAFLEEMNGARAEMMNSRAFLQELRLFLDEHPDVDDQFGAWQAARLKAAKENAVAVTAPVRRKRR